MWRVLLISLTLSALVRGLNEEHVHGMKRLLGRKHGIFPTCEIILFSEMVNFTVAEKNCEDFDIGTGANHAGNLATVNDEGKNRALKLLLAMAYKPKKAKKRQWDADQWVWAGMRKVRNNLAKDAKRKYDPNDWEWADGSSPTTFKKWMRKQPDQQRDGDFLQNQMRINNKGSWDDTYAYKEHPYACDYQGKYVISPKRTTWTAARTACQKAGLDLAKVRNAQEVQEIMKAAEYFLGSRHSKRWHPSNWIWTGGNDIAVEGDWRWISDNTVVDLGGIEWHRGMPDNAPNYQHNIMGQHALAISKWGTFDDSYTTVRRRPFACQCPNT